MTSKRPFGLPSVRLIVVAAVVGILGGILAGALAVYVRNAGSGNGADAQLSASSMACDGAVRKAASVRELARGEVAAMVAAQPPRPLELTFQGADGQSRKIQDFGGKTVLFNLWATWCGPCREEMPALNALQKTMGGADFEVVAVNIDTGGEDKPKNFYADYGIDALGFYRDSSMGVFNALKKEGLAFGLPATLLVDAKGCLLGAMNGPAAWDSADAKALVSAAKASE